MCIDNNLFQKLTYFFFILFFISCKQKEKKVDVSSIKHSFQSIRFDEALYTIDTNQLQNAVSSLIEKYPLFSDIYFKEITGFAKTNDSNTFYQSVKHFITYKDYVNLQDSVRFYFKDLKKTDDALLDLFKHIKYYFPKTPLGDVYYFTSGLNNWSAVTIDSNIGVGLDMYLGKQYPFYGSVQLPGYQIARCEKEYIPINVCKAIYENDHNMDATNCTLLDLMIKRGKELMYTSYMLPNEDDYKLIGYTKEQYQWCIENEAAIWNYFSKQKLLYSTNWQDILRYVQDGPTSTGMPAECPGNIGSFIGWQLIKKYMNQQLDKDIVQLINENKTAQTILQESSYRPH